MAAIAPGTGGASTSQILTSVGSALSSAAGPIGGAALGVLPSAVQGIVSAADPNARDYRKYLRKQRERLKTAGGFELSEAEKAAGVSGAIRAAEASTRGLRAEAQRQGAAQGFGRSGAATSATQDIGQSLARAGSEARGQMEKLSQEVADRRKQQALAEIKAQRDKVQQDWMNAAQGAVSGATGSMDRQIEREKTDREAIAERF